jgi:hypothetical protein
MTEQRVDNQADRDEDRGTHRDSDEVARRKTACGQHRQQREPEERVENERRSDALSCHGEGRPTTTNAGPLEQPKGHDGSGSGAGGHYSIDAKRCDDDSERMPQAGTVTVIEQCPRELRIRDESRKRAADAEEEHEDIDAGERGQRLPDQWQLGDGKKPGCCRKGHNLRSAPCVSSNQLAPQRSGRDEYRVEDARNGRIDRVRLGSSFDFNRWQFMATQESATNSSCSNHLNVS